MDGDVVWMIALKMLYQPLNRLDELGKLGCWDRS